MLAEVRSGRGRLKWGLAHSYGCTHHPLTLATGIFDLDEIIVFPNSFIGDDLSVIAYGRKTSPGFFE